MALNFPDSPALNDIYTDSTSGFSYQWDGTVWKSYSSASTNNIRTLDDISASFNGVTNSFALSVSGSAVTPANAQQLLISVGGVMQSPNTDYTISGSSIIFTTPPISGLTFFGTIIGTAVPVGITTVGEVYRQQSYAVTGVQTSFSFPAGYTVGYLEVYRNGVRLIDGSDFTATDGSSFDLITPAQNGDDVEAVGYITASIAVANGNLTSLLVNNDAQVLGVTTLGTNVGAGQTALYVEGNARITGILTVGSSSVTIDGTNNQITVGTGNVIDGSTPNQIKVGSGLTVTSSGAVVGIITATTFSGSGSGLTGIVTSVNPVGQTTTSQAGTTTIDLSLGSIIYFNHNTDTTVAFANTATSQELRFVRTKDNTTTARNITWPTNVYWDGGPDAPSLQNEGATGNTQVFTLITRDSGVTWSGFESQKFAGIGTYFYAWGNNSHGQLGVGDIDDRFNVNLYENSTLYNSASVFNLTSLRLKNDGTLWASGRNSAGTLGQSNRNDYSSPVQIPGTSWSFICAGGQHSLAIKTDGTLWVWGANANGELGQTNRTYYSSPNQVPGTQWSTLSSNYSGSFAIKTDGTLWAWGANTNGQLGQTNRTYYSSPVQIPGTSWSSIDGAQNHILATKTDGTLWAWGVNSAGQLGQSDTGLRSSPVQIPGTQWSSISGGNGESLATKTDGTLWAWGANFSGQLGQGDKTQYSSPRQIPGTTWSTLDDAISIYSSANAIKTDGTLWAWGTNSDGQLGQGDATDYSSPRQIPGTNWKYLSNQGIGFAFKTIT